MVALIFGLLMGTFTGILVAYLNFQGFVASLAVMTIARGVAYTITNATPVNLPSETLNTLTSKSLGYPIIWIMLIVVIIFVVICKYTKVEFVVTICTK